MSTGTCRFCGDTFEKKGIARHVVSCKERISQGEGEEQKTYHHLMVEDKRDKAYWLDILVDPDAALTTLDVFLRRMWLECCGHQSKFRIGDTSYVSEPDRWYGEVSMDVPLADIPAELQRFKYYYDFGSTTALTIRRMKPVEHHKADKPIIIAARNDPPVFPCHCGEEAHLFCRLCIYEDEEHAYLCEQCAAKHLCEPEYLAPLTNSPRMGECGYYGSQYDRRGEYPFFDQAEKRIRELFEKADERVFETGSKEEQQRLIRQKINELRVVPVRGKNFRSALFMTKFPHEFGDHWTDIISQTVTAWKEKGTTPTDKAHLFALFLSAYFGNHYVFSLIAPFFREDQDEDILWGEALFDPSLVSALFASMCRGKPELLFELAIDREVPDYRRVNALDALVALYFNWKLGRKTLEGYIHHLTDAALEEKNNFLGESLAYACCDLYPHEFIKDVQQLHYAGLLPSGKDFLGKVSSILKDNESAHLKEKRKRNQYPLMDDPIAELQYIFKWDWDQETQEQEDDLGDPFSNESASTAFDYRPQEPLPQPAAGYELQDDGSLVREEKKVGRNDPCPCGSGKKYKKCCGR